jgi:hypothetical protein
MNNNNFNTSESEGLEALASIRRGLSPSLFTDKSFGENRLSQLQQEIEATGARLAAEVAARDEERRRLEKLEELERKQRQKSSVATINLSANNYSSNADNPTYKRKFEKLDDDVYAHKSNSGAPAFIENDGRIELQSSEPEVIKDLVQMLYERGVQAIAIEGGTPEVNDRLWLQASLLGMQVNGYTPENPAIHKELEQLKAQQPKPNFWDKNNLDPDYHAIVDEYNEKLQTLASDLRSNPQQYAIEVAALGTEYEQKAKKIAEAKQALQQEVVSPRAEVSEVQTDDVTAAHEAGTHPRLQAPQQSQSSKPDSPSLNIVLPTESEIKWMKKFVSEIVLDGDKLTPVLINGMADADRLKFLQEVKAQQQTKQMRDKIQVAKWSDSNLKFGERVTEDSAQGITLKQGHNDKRTKIFVVSASDAAGKLGYSPGQANSEINGGAIKKDSGPRTLEKL